MPQIQANGIELEVELHGPGDGRPLVLVSGLGRQLVHWSPELLGGLVEAGHRLVVFDNRDVGLSTHLDGAPAPSLLDVQAALAEGRDPGVAYCLVDMAEDLLGLLDALELPSVHVMGTSMGGMIAQEAALLAPERFRTLTSIMSTTGEPGLPPPKPEAAALLVIPTAGGREAYVQQRVEQGRVLAGPGYPFDESATREMWEVAYDRCFDPLGVARQLASTLVGPPRHERLPLLEVPTLVIHGDADPLIPHACGEATAAAVPGSTLHTVAGMGHDIPAGARPEVVAAIEAHTRAHDVVAQAIPG